MKFLRVLSRKERVRQAAAYLQWSKQRNGEVGLENHTLAAREVYFSEHAANPVKWDGQVCLDEYSRVLNAISVADIRHCSHIAIFAGLLASVNMAEAYAIEIALAIRRRTDLKDPMTTIEIEEIYHTRILVDALSVLGLNAEMRKPRGFMRLFLLLAAILPHSISSMLGLVGEIGAVLMFVALREKTSQLLGTETTAGRRILDLIEQILIDEVGHLVYVRTQLGRIRMWVVRNLLPLVAPIMFNQHPAGPALFDVRKMARQAAAMELDFIPPDIRARAFQP